MIVSDTAGLTKGSEQLVSVRCDTCGKSSKTTYSNYYHSQERRGWPGTTYCRGCACRISADKRKGKPAHNKGKKLPDEQKGENHPSWKGGRYISHDGYVMVHVGGEKNDIGWSCYKKEHVVVCERATGRKLNKNEVVHHLDGNKQNNCADNLWLTSHSGHRVAHQSLQELGYEMIKAGVIVFDRQLGKYQWRDADVGCNEQCARNKSQMP